MHRMIWTDSPLNNIHIRSRCDMNIIIQFIVWNEEHVVFIFQYIYLYISHITYDSLPIMILRNFCFQKTGWRGGVRKGRESMGKDVSCIIHSLFSSYVLVKVIFCFKRNTRYLLCSLWRLLSQIHHPIQRIAANYSNLYQYTPTHFPSSLHWKPRKAAAWKDPWKANWFDFLSSLAERKQTRQRKTRRL